MRLQTTVIGSWPKPDYLQIPDWFWATVNDERLPNAGGYETTLYDEFLNRQNSEELEMNIQRAVMEVIKTQSDIGIDIITDGEMRRENYILHFLRNIEGCDFQKQTKVSFRDGAYEGRTATITGKVKLSRTSPIVREWLQTQQLTDRTVKYTLPGPMTIIDSIANEFYHDEESLCTDLAAEINQQIHLLKDAGCKHIQVDEPVLMRYPEKAANYGIDILKKCFEGIGDKVYKVVHLCCGYPDKVDFDDYPKADKNNYFRLAKQLDGAGFDAVSIEDAEVRNDLSLLSKFHHSAIILGCVCIARSRVESVEEIRTRAREALKYISADRLMLAPDCGLGYLPMDLLVKKLTNMVAAAADI